MKDVKVLAKIKLFCFVLCILCFAATLSVGAEPIDTPPDFPEYTEGDTEAFPEENPEEYPDESPEDYPEESPEDYPEDNTEQYPEDTEGALDTDETVTASDLAGEVETSTVPRETEPEPTYRAPLPSLETEVEIPEAIGSAKEENEPNLFWGFVCWICIGVGIAVILAVLLTTKTGAYRSGGKKRYSSGDKISGKQRLLNDKYYNNHKRK